MKQLFLMVNDGRVQLLDTPAPIAKDDHVLVKTLYSAVSAGTERGLTSFGQKNLIQKALARPDQVKKVLEKMHTDGILTGLEAAFNKMKEPMPMGYSAVGRIIECGRGVTECAKGDIVAMVGQAYHAEINRVNKNLIAKIPFEFQDYKQGALSALGGVALEGIHQAKVIPGEIVAIIGMGLLGHITARILNAYGCDVIGYDIQEKTSIKTNLKAFINTNDDNLSDITKSITSGRGVDKVIITASADSNEPMDIAAEIIRDKGIICMVGVTEMNIDRRLYYEKELTFTIARSYGPGRYDSDYEQKGIDYPIGYVRFTEGRNIEEFIRLLKSGRLDCSDLITHVFDFQEAEKAYEIITTNRNHEKYVGILLKYEENHSEIDRHICIKRPQKNYTKNALAIGLIGAGNFVKASMLPMMKETGLYSFKGLATTGGTNAAQVNHTTPFAYLTNDYKELLEDEEIDLIVVATGHDSHAKFVVEALRAGKHVYCEKPLCLTLNELEEIKNTYKNTDNELFCGLNRRHAPFIQMIKKELSTDKIPAMYEYVVNAGFIPEKHWVQDEKIGGGRIIGEACHFVDTIQYLDGSKLIDLNIQFLNNDAFSKKDNCIINLKFESGAIGNVLYTSMGSKKYPKERLKVFSDGIVYELDNYIKLIRYGNRKKTSFKLKQDKGLEKEYRYISNVILGKQENNSVDDAFVGMKMLLKSWSN